MKHGNFIIASGKATKSAAMHSREWHQAHRAEVLNDAIRAARAKTAKVREVMKAASTSTSVRLTSSPKTTSFRDWRLSLKANRERAERERTAVNRAKRS